MGFLEKQFLTNEIEKWKEFLRWKKFWMIQKDNSSLLLLDYVYRRILFALASNTWFVTVVELLPAWYKE